MGTQFCLGLCFPSRLSQVWPRLSHGSLCDPGPISWPLLGLFLEHLCVFLSRKSMRVREATSPDREPEEPVLQALPAPAGGSAGRADTWGRAWPRGRGLAPACPPLATSPLPIRGPSGPHLQFQGLNPRPSLRLGVPRSDRGCPGLGMNNLPSVTMVKGMGLESGSECRSQLCPFFVQPRASDSTCPIPKKKD